jgi:hypothetical protein
MTKKESTDKDITIDKAILVDRISLIEGMTQYLITDNPIVENDILLKLSAEKVSEQLLKLKNNIQK